MLLWLKDNLATVILSLVLLLIAASIVYSLIKNKKKGVSSCGCSCGGCPMASKCHSTTHDK